MINEIQTHKITEHIMNLTSPIQLLGQLEMKTMIRRGVGIIKVDCLQQSIHHSINYCLLTLSQTVLTCTATISYTVD